VVRSSAASDVYKRQELLDVVSFHQFKWQALFLMNNFIQPDFRDGGYQFWFVVVLVQNLVLLACLFAVKSVRRLVRTKPFEFALIGTFVMAGVAALTHLGGRRAFYDHVPTAYLGAMFLGWTIVQADTMRRRLWLMIATVATFLEPFLRARDNEVLVLPFVATFCLVTWRQVSLPVHIARAVNLIAGASLFIYLIDFQVKKIADKTPLLDHPAITVVFAVFTGIAVWKCWTAGLGLATRWIQQKTDANKGTSTKPVSDRKRKYVECQLIS
jgi:hypothetical protein